MHVIKVNIFLYGTAQYSRTDLISNAEEDDKDKYEPEKFAETIYGFIFSQVWHRFFYLSFLSLYQKDQNAYLNRSTCGDNSRGDELVRPNHRNNPAVWGGVRLDDKV